MRTPIGDNGLGKKVERAMGERARRAAGHVSWTLGREHGGDPSHGAEEAHALSGPARPEARQDGRGVPSLEHDPYQDEGGEG
jgi:hypothetical protein